MVYLAFQGLTPNVNTGIYTVSTHKGISPGESVPVVRLPREMSESAALVCRPEMVAAIREGRRARQRRGNRRGNLVGRYFSGFHAFLEKDSSCGLLWAREWNESGRPRHEME